MVARVNGPVVKSTDPKIVMSLVAEKYLSPQLAEALVSEMLTKMGLTDGKALKTEKAAPKAGKVWTDEERKAAGLRMITARADKLGLTVDELRTLKLRPGTAPTAEQMKAIMKARGKAEKAPEAQVVPEGVSTKPRKAPTPPKK